MTTSKASPRPFVLPFAVMDTGADDIAWVEDGEGHVVIGAIRRSAADYIVLAVNHFEEMRAIIQRCSEWLDSEGLYDTEVDKLLAKLTEADDE